MLLASLVVANSPGVADAQSAPLASSPGSSLPAAVLRDLPLGGNVFAMAETMQPEAVTDRFNNGGLNAAGAARAGAFLASWSQTQYRVGDVNISSPVDGTPLLFPELAWWREVGVATGLMRADVTASGLAVSLEPARGTPHWTGAVEVSGSGGGLVAAPPAGKAPPIARLEDSIGASGMISGPMTDRMGLAAGGSWTSASAFARAPAAAGGQQARSAFAHVTTGPAGRDLRTLVWIQSLETPFALAAVYQQPGAATRDRAVHLQSTFERSGRDETAWRVTGAYTRRSRTSDHDPVSNFVADRLTDGPIPSLVETGDGVEQRWSVSARVAPPWSVRRHAVVFGGEVAGIAARAQPSFRGTVVEHVDGVPARRWVYANPGLDSQRSAMLVTAFAHDRIRLSESLALDAALRFESANGRARGAAQDITWISWLPSARLRWDLGTPLQFVFTVGGGRSASQLTLNLLAQGDPAAPTAQVFRWDGPLVSRAGPGTAGDPGFSSIDPRLKRPVTDEFAIGLEARPRPALRLGVAGLARRQSSLINVVNTGAPEGSYTTFTIPDDNADLVGTADDQLLTVYNRRPESFGQDRYLLTNPGQEDATMGAVVVSARITTDRLWMWIGGTAAAATGSGGNRGFRAVENDQDALGELFTNPNAATYARGRLFADRAYTIKWTTVWRLPADIRLGAIARYQDGQPFSRMVVVPGLNQGAEAIQAFANGRSRFAFTGTLDVRLQKGFAAGARRVDAILDAYNLLNMTKEVEEYVVTGPRFRETTAIQPPRAIHLGLRLVF